MDPSEKKKQTKSPEKMEAWGEEKGGQMGGEGKEENMGKWDGGVGEG